MTDAAAQTHRSQPSETADWSAWQHFLLHRSTTAVAPSCYLQDLFTDPAARSTGVGRALIEAVARWAGEAGAARVYWHTQETNRTARLLSDRVALATGFVVYSRPVEPQTP